MAVQGTPTQNINFNIYDSESNMLLGVAEVELPNFEAMSETISGAGLAGEIDMPTLGHFGSMTVSLSWRTMNANITKLLAPKAHQLDFRASVQNYDKNTGTITSVSVKHTVTVVPKSTGFGNLNVGTGSDSSSEFELVYIKTLIDGVEAVEYDKFNYIFRVHGVDHLASVRRDLGLAG